MTLFKSYRESIIIKGHVKAQKLKGDTVIGNDVWIGVEAMIVPGLKI